MISICFLKHLYLQNITMSIFVSRPWNFILLVSPYCLYNSSLRISKPSVLRLMSFLSSRKLLLFYLIFCSAKMQWSISSTNCLPKSLTCLPNWPAYVPIHTRGCVHATHTHTPLSSKENNFLPVEHDLYWYKVKKKNRHIIKF